LNFIVAATDAVWHLTLRRNCQIEGRNSEGNCKEPFLKMIERKTEMKSRFRRVCIFGLLVTAILFTRNAGAAITTILPESSYLEGRAYYPAGRIEYAVYDTITYPDEFIGADGFTAPGTGQYIYAYQIFTDDISTFPAEFFAVTGIADGAFEEPINDNIGSVNDSPSDPDNEGVEPDMAYITSSSMRGTMGVWEFDDSLVGGAHSYFLVLRSGMDWDWGTYTFNKNYADGQPVPGGAVSNPEPATIALLGIGGALAILRRRRFA
jgi:hypothetical protein